MKIPTLLSLSAAACAAFLIPQTSRGVEITNYTKPVTPTPQDAAKFADAEYELAKVYLKGQSGPQNLQKAFNLMKSAAEHGHAEAMGGVGYFYATGLLVGKNDAEAIAWFRKGAEAGGPKAQLNLGQMLAQGLGTPKDEKEGLLWITRSADQNLPDAWYALGSVYYFGKYGNGVDYKKAFPYLLKAAEADNPDAQNMVGFMLEGLAGIDPDEARAEFWYRKAAERGNAKAQCNLGRLLDPASKDGARRIEALTWLFISHNQNEVTAEKALEEALPAAQQDEVSEAQRKAGEFAQARKAAAGQ